MKMLKKQQQAIDFFDTHGYLVVESCRRAGKTALLRTIVAKSKAVRIAVVCPSYHFFKQYYGGFKNCKFVESVDRLAEDSWGLVIGDEVLIEPTSEHRTACALTKRYVTIRWGLDELPFDKSELERIKKELSDTFYEVEFGQYNRA